MPESILVIDDDKILLQNIKRLLDTQHYQTETINVSSLALERIEEKSFSCILLDVRMPGLNGLDLLNYFNKKCIQTPVIMVSGQSNIETAVQAIKLGAFDFIEKPIDPDRLLVSIKNATEKNSLVQDNRSLSEANINFNKELEEKYRMVGKSRAMQDVFEMIKKTAEVDAKVLITGESGTGKELVAWAIHHNGARKTKPYIKVNCASIPNELLESELFGHKKGSFTGAVSDQKGKFQAAEGGTLFLDEIGEMDFKMQAKLLRVLQGSEIEVIGETTPRKIDVRIIAATNQNLEQLIKEGRFREDLFHRLNLIRIHLLPLNKRKDDILPLANFFLNKLSSDYNKRIEHLTAPAEQLL
ncbi:MAG: sigma-54-dependent Fis family transcriptional regulator, partial [Calditrichaeota bacterium]|nr:sigma-54-dependent Fis family transcriptional regulator [Calditrichota bacterium]